MGSLLAATMAPPTPATADEVERLMCMPVGAAEGDVRKVLVGGRGLEGGLLWTPGHAQGGPATLASSGHLGIRLLRG